MTSWYCDNTGMCPKHCTDDAQYATFSHLSFIFVLTGLFIILSHGKKNSSIIGNLSICSLLFFHLNSRCGAAHGSTVTTYYDEGIFRVHLLTFLKWCSHSGLYDYWLYILISQTISLAKSLTWNFSARWMGLCQLLWVTWWVASLVSISHQLIWMFHFYPITSFYSSLN